MDETTIDPAAMGRLARALTFICGPEVWGEGRSVALMDTDRLPGVGPS